jgi:hypothetical protein
MSLCSQQKTTRGGSGRAARELIVELAQYGIGGKNKTTQVFINAGIIQ